MVFFLVCLPCRNVSSRVQGLALLLTVSPAPATHEVLRKYLMNNSVCSACRGTAEDPGKRRGVPRASWCPGWLRSCKRPASKAQGGEWSWRSEGAWLLKNGCWWCWVHGAGREREGAGGSTGRATEDGSLEPGLCKLSRDIYMGGFVPKAFGQPGLEMKRGHCFSFCCCSNK